MYVTYDNRLKNFVNKYSSVNIEEYIFIIYYSVISGIKCCLILDFQMVMLACHRSYRPAIQSSLITHYAQSYIMAASVYRIITNNY